MSALFFDMGAASKCGRRSKNEDASTISPDGKLFAVADGIGGAPMGDIMSTVACNAAVDAYMGEPALFGAFDAASYETFRVKSLLRPGSEGAGTTFLAAEREGNELKVAWVGDSAALLLRDGKLTFIAAPDNVEHSNELGSALGYFEETLPLYTACSLKAGDRVLLCTDGVWSVLEVERLVELLSTQANAAWLAQLITKEAVECGYDNATAIVLAVEEGEGEPASEEDVACPDLSELPVVPCTPSYPAVDYA